MILHVANMNLNLAFTFAKENIVLPGVCVSVYLLGNSYKTTERKYFTGDESLDKEDIVKFRKSSGSGSGCKNFEGIFLIIVG